MDRRLQSLVVAVFLVPAPGQAQGAVSGQVTIMERESASTDDLGDAVVYLEPVGGARLRLASTNTAMNLQSRKFSPRVRVVGEGSLLAFTNQDPFNHNVFSKAPSGTFDTGVFGRGRTRETAFREAGVIPIYCDVHPKMTGYVIVLSTPYYAQAGTDGRFTIPRVPAGRYVVHAWHDRASGVTREVDITAAGATLAPVQLDARGWRFVQHKNKRGLDYTSARGDIY